MFIKGKMYLEYKMNNILEFKYRHGLKIKIKKKLIHFDGT